MSLQSPDIVLYDINGLVMAVQNGSAIPANTSAILAAGSDGTNAHNLLTDSGGRLIVDGYGTAFNNSSIGSIATTAPTSATYVGGLVTTAVESGLVNGDLYALSLTTAGLLRVDGSNVTQPANIIQFGGTNISTGTGAGGAGIPRVTVSNDSSIIATQTTASQLNATIVGTATDNTANVTTKVPAIVAVASTLTPAATATDMISLSVTTGTAGSGGGGLLRIDHVYPVGTANTVALDVAQSGGLATTASPAYSNNNLYPLSLDGYGDLRTLGYGSVTSAAPSYSAGTPSPLSLDTAGNLRVSGSFAVTTDKSTTGTITSPAAATSSFTVLAANASRVLASVYNATNKTLYLAMAATASTSAYTVQVAVGAYFELSLTYTGIITGISPAGVSGNVQVTEYT